MPGITLINLFKWDCKANGNVKVVIIQRTSIASSDSSSSSLTELQKKRIAEKYNSVWDL